MELGITIFVALLVAVIAFVKAFQI